jgi:hypothetical protein
MKEGRMSSDRRIAQSRWMCGLRVASGAHLSIASSAGGEGGREEQNMLGSIGGHGTLAVCATALPFASATSASVNAEGIECRCEQLEIGGDHLSVFESW